MGDWVLRYSATHVTVPSANLMRPQTFDELEAGCLELWSRAVRPFRLSFSPCSTTELPSVRFTENCG